MTTPSKDTLTTEQKLELLRTDELIADVREGFAEIERGEVSIMTMDDLKRELLNQGRCKNTRHS